VELIADQIVRAEAPELRDAFSAAMRKRLADGTLLLLLDGMDEIAGVQSKLELARQLRTFVSIFPSVRLVATSREAGFRPIAGTFAEICRRFVVADLTDQDIETLSIAWHQETVGQSLQTRKDASKLARDICRVDRVRRLASNPLLLTTLLLVHRWVGQMPRRRSVLYGKAVEVLLMTWNVEGHSPIDPDEVLPQLGFVAYAMMKDGKKTVFASELKSLLRLARAEMPDILMNTRFSVTELIDKIEERSSLLAIAGHDVFEGSLEPMYEFRHLTFQEYLCARAIVGQWLPSELMTSSVVELIKPYFLEDSWSEVVVLTAALSGRSSSAIVQAVISELPSKPDGNSTAARDRYDEKTWRLCQTISGCLGDNIPVQPAILDVALDSLTSMHLQTTPALELVGSRYEDSLRQTVRQKIEKSTWLDAPLVLFTDLAGIEHANEEPAPFLRKVSRLLSSSDLEKRLDGQAELMLACWTNRGFDHPVRPLAKRVRLSSLRRPMEITARLILSDTLKPYEFTLATWALGWSGKAVADEDLINRLQRDLLLRWIKGSDNPQYIPWTIMSLPLVGVWDLSGLGLDAKTMRTFFGRLLKSGVSNRSLLATYAYSYYMDLPWPRKDLAVRVVSDERLLRGRLGSVEGEFIERFLIRLGEPRRRAQEASRTMMMQSGAKSRSNKSGGRTRLAT
jgi:hypothetical protein